MICPCCDNKMKVIESRVSRTKSYVARTHKCFNCQMILYSKETFVDYSVVKDAFHSYAKRRGRHAD